MQDAAIESWIRSPSFPDYEVSSLGRIRRAVAASMGDWPAGRFLKPRKRKGPRNNGFYYRIVLRRDSRPHDQALHRILAEAFLGPPPSPKHTVNHRDGNGLNNRMNNLEWATNQQNVQHAFDVGLGNPQRGEMHGQAKLTEADVRVIRSGEFTMQQCAKRFGITWEHARRVRDRVVWAHVE